MRFKFLSIYGALTLSACLFAGGQADSSSGAAQKQGGMQQMEPAGSVSVSSEFDAVGLAEAKQRHIQNLDRHIEALSARLAKKKSGAPVGDTAALSETQVPEMVQLSGEMEILELDYLKNMRVIADLEGEAKMKAMFAWAESEKGKRMRELRDRMGELHEAQEYDNIKSTLAALESSEDPTEEKLLNSKTRRIEMLKMQLSDMELSKKLKSASPEERALLLNERRAKNLIPERKE